MRQFLEWWLQRPVSLVIFTSIIIFIGAVSLYNIPLELSPDVDFPQVTIRVYSPDSSPEMIEALVSAPIESRMQELADIRKIESVSKNNYSLVTLHFDRRADMAFNLFRINEILSDYKTWLPKGAFRPSVQKYIPEEFKQEIFLSYRLLTKLPEKELYHLAQEKIRRPLLNVPGVAAVHVFGLRTPQVEVLLNLDRMRRYGVSLNKVRKKLTGRKIHVGDLKPGFAILPLSVDFRFQNINDLKNILFKISPNRTIKLADIADVRQGYRKLRYKKRINGKHTVLISIEKESGANTISVADRVYEAIGNIEKQLPPGNQLMLVDDASEQIRAAIKDLLWRTFFALAAIFLLLLIVLKRFSYSLTIILSIMLSVFTVFIFIKFLGYSVNLLTLAGLALGFGFMVDNSILVFDAIEMSGKPQKIVSESLKILFPIFASTLTTLAALLPFIFLSEKLRLYYIPFGVVVAAALLASVAFAYLFIPSSYSHLQKRIKPASRDNRFFKKVEHIYQLILTKALRHKKMVVFFALWSFGFPLWLLPDSIDKNKDAPMITDYLITAYNHTIGSEIYHSFRTYSDPILGGAAYLFFKYVERGEPWNWRGGDYLFVYINMPQGSDLGLSEKIILDFEKIALAQQGIGKVETTISPSAAYMRIDFPKENITSYVPYYLKEKLIQRAVKVGGAAISVSGFGDPYSSGYAGNFSPFRIKLTGYNFMELKKLAIKLKNRLEKNRRVRDVDINTPLGYSMEALSYLEMKMNRLALASCGLTPSDVISLLKLYTSETLSGEHIRLGNEEKFMAIKSSDFRGLQLDALKGMWFQSPGKPPFRLGQFAKIRKRRVLPEIRRENQEYLRMVSFDFLGPYRFGAKYLEKTLKNFKPPIGYSVKPVHWTWGENEESNLIFIIFLGLLFIYMVTAALYESFGDPFLIFLTIPAGLVGIFLVFYLTDTIFNRSAYMGVLFISGIVVNNSIILVSKLKYLKQDGHSAIDAVIKGSVRHLKPIFLTTFTTVLGFLPMLILSANKANDLWYTLALTGLSGMLSSFIFILFVLPVLFALTHKS